MGVLAVSHLTVSLQWRWPRQGLRRWPSRGTAGARSTFTQDLGGSWLLSGAHPAPDLMPVKSAESPPACGARM